jgi:hypothetical protein
MLHAGWINPSPQPGSAGQLQVLLQNQTLLWLDVNKRLLKYPRVPECSCHAKPRRTQDIDTGVSVQPVNCFPAVVHIP